MFQTRLGCFARAGIFVSRTLAALALVSLIAAPGCKPCATSTTPKSPKLKFKFVDAPLEAELQQSVTITWEYTGATALKSQNIRLMQAVPNGLVGAEQIFSLSKSARSYTFTFKHPVTIWLTAYDTSGKEKNAVFDIAWSSDYFLEASGVVSFHPNYPRIGFDQGMVKGEKFIRDIQFNQFMAFYDSAGSKPALIDDLVTAGVTPKLEFAGRSWSPNESEKFNFSPMGARFARNCPGVGAARVHPGATAIAKSDPLQRRSGVGGAVHHVGMRGLLRLSLPREV